MRQFQALVRQFGGDERGVFAVIFALLAIVLVATAGAVVDFTTVEQARARAQDALDSAALGLQPRIFDEPPPSADTLKAEAQALLIERLADVNVTATVQNVEINETEGKLRLEGSITVPMAFVSLVGIENLSASVISEATRKRLNVEIAMVLDNSGSMSSSNRMTNLKAAATCAMNILFNGVSDCLAATMTATTPLAATQTNVAIGIVPFTSFVNVGTASANASWMDKNGLSDISNDNFDNDDNEATPFNGPLNRFALYDQMPNVTWQGCVEARKYPYDTTDETPTSGNPDTLFVPEFAPSEPPFGFTNAYISPVPTPACTQYPTCTWTRTTGYYGYGGSTNSYRLTQLNGSYTSGPGVCNCNSDGILSDTQYYSGSNLVRVRTCQVGLTPRDLQQRQCKYTGNINTSGGRGPNQDCPTNALTPLTNTKATVNSAISAMYPQGYTNIHQGTIWGYHMLTHSAPLTEAKEAGTATNKIMIIMTDGENTIEGFNSSNMNMADSYFAYGYPWNGRIFSTTNPTPSTNSQITEAMDARTMETCANAKADGIVIYTIGLNAPNQKTIDMLTACATSSAHDFFPTQASELVSTFQQIASELSDLRLAE